MTNDTKEWRRLCSVVRAKTRADRETYFNRLADEAKEGLSNNQLKGAYSKRHQANLREGLSKPAVFNQQSGWPAVRLKGRDPDEVAEALCNDAHPPATACPNLDRDAASVSEAADVCSDAISLQVLDAIAWVKNGRAASPDGIAPELFKCPT